MGRRNKLQKETYKIKCPKHIVFGDPLYFEKYKGTRMKKLVVDYEVPTKFDTARLVLEEKPFEGYPGMMRRTMTIFLATYDHMDVYLSNHKYKVQQEENKVIGVDTARYLLEVDGRYDEIKTMADGVWGNASEFYRMDGNRRISDAVIIVVDVPEDKDFQGMRELAQYFFEDMAPCLSDAIQWAGWIWRGQVVWDKMTSRPQKGRYRQQSEYMLWASNGPLPIDRPVGCLPGVFRYTNPAKRIHVTEKPLQLMRDIVHICVPGGRILDPFAGAGTTILAAVQEGYEAVGVEVTDAYYRLGGDRVRTALADGDERTAKASNGEQGIQLDAQKR